MVKRYQIGILAPVIAFVSIAASIIMSPWFDWTQHDLSHLGMYENGSAAAIIFNGGLMATGVLMLIFFIGYTRSVDETSIQLLMLPFIIAMASLTLIGVFPAGSGPVHFIASLGFLLSFPFAMSIVGISWIRIESRRVFAAASLVVGILLLLMWILVLISPSFTFGAAIPETLTAVSAAIWLWLAWSRYMVRRTPPA
ncbi:MAG: DUF998 domain-containing protein [Candidatus Thorarchaeota archaeon]